MTAMNMNSNKTINNIQEKEYEYAPGKIVISNRSAEKASAIIISDEGVRIVNPIAIGGVTINKDGVNLQGTTFQTSKGENNKKGEYSENPRSSKIFTYKETVLLESIPKELASDAASIMGINIANGLTGAAMDGIMPIMTDIAASPIPHFHTISMKHVHRIEPAYLYRIPSAVNIIKGALEQLKGFFKA